MSPAKTAAVLLLSSTDSTGAETMLPGSLEEAVAAFEGDAFIMEALGDHVYTKYLEAKKSEWEDYRTKVSQWELENYLIKY